jgi:hypothetical protein
MPFIVIRIEGGLGAGGAADASEAAQGGIQQQYDNAYSQCMYSRGNLVAAYEPPPDFGSRTWCPRG